jgi:hypothetical protein
MFTKSLVGLICLSCAILAGAGSQATITSITVTPLRNREISPSTDPRANLVKVEALVRRFYGNIASPVALRVYEGDSTVVATRQNMTRLKGVEERFLVNAIAVPEGRLRYEVEVSLAQPSTNETRVISRVLEQESPIPNYCFFFQTGGTRGWSGSNYLRWYEQNSQPACGREVTPLIDTSARDSDIGGLPNFGLRMSFAFSVGAGGNLIGSCFRNPHADADWTSANFVSPDLSQMNGWRNATGFDLQAFDQVEGARMKFLIEDTDGRFWSDGFYDLSWGYSHFGMTKPSHAGQIRRILIRIFVPEPVPFLMGENPGFFVDRICPRLR